MVGIIPHTIAYGMHYMVCIGIPHGYMTMSHDYVLCLVDHVVCLFENCIPHDWDYFHLQHNTDHTQYFYECCLVYLTHRKLQTIIIKP